MNKGIYYITGGLLLTAVLIMAGKKTIEKVVESWTNLLGRKDLPRGLRNNNPGNLIKTSIAWQGKLPHESNTDTRFEQFKALPLGFRAMAIDLRTKITKRGLDTIEKFMPVYAPPFENNTESYIKNVAARSGIARNQKLTGSKEELRKLVEAMSIIENGQVAQNYFSDIDIAFKLFV